MDDLSRRMVRLRCQMGIDGETVFAEVPVDQQLWTQADEETRESFREHARLAVAQQIVARHRPEVTVVEESPTMAEAVADALAAYDAEA